MIRGDPAKKPVKDLTDIIDRLARKAQTDRSINLTDLYEQALSPSVINANVVTTFTVAMPKPPVLPVEAALALPDALLRSIKTPTKASLMRPLNVRPIGLDVLVMTTME